MVLTPEIITVPPGTEINCGLSEDSDSVIATKPTKLLIISSVQNGARKVRILDNGQASDQIFFYHQPEA